MPVTPAQNRIERRLARDRRPIALVDVNRSSGNYAVPVGVHTRRCGVCLPLFADCGCCPCNVRPDCARRARPGHERQVQLLRHERRCGGPLRCLPLRHGWLRALLVTDMYGRLSVLPGDPGWWLVVRPAYGHTERVVRMATTDQQRALDYAAMHNIVPVLPIHWGDRA